MAISSILAFGIGSLVLRTRRRDLESYTGSEVRFPPYVLLEGIVGFLFFISVALVSNLFPNETVTVITTSVFVIFSTLSGYQAFLYFAQRHQICDSHILFTSMFNTQTKIYWKVVAAVSYNPGIKWFVVETTSGKKYHISEIMRGIRQFSVAVIANVEPDKIARTASERLQKLQEGKLVE